MSEERQERPRSHRRRQLVVDKRLQFSIMFTVVGGIATICLIFLSVNFVLPQQEALEALGGEGVHTLIVRLIVGFFLSSALTLGSLLLIVSHRVAGPAMVFERALRAFSRGSYDARVKTRRRDYLKNVSDAMQDLKDQLIQDRAHRASCLDQLQAAMESRDEEVAGRLLSELRLMDHAAPRDPKKPRVVPSRRNARPAPELQPK